MADALFIRLGENGAAEWATFAPTGQITSPISRGALTEARGSADGRRVVVLVPGIDVLSTQAELPASSQARMRQIVPFSLEDSLAADVDGLMFAVGARLSPASAGVAVVSKAKLDAWLAELGAAGIVPQALYSETEGVPEIPATLLMLLEGTRIYVRVPGQSPFVLDGMTARQTLDLLRSAGAAAEIKHSIAYADPADQARFQTELTEVADAFESAEAKVAVDGLFPHLAATLAQRPGTNLLQGSYAPKSNWLELARPWRHAASLLAAAGVLALTLQGAEYWTLRRADAELASLVAETCQKAVGTNRASACDTLVQQRLRARGSATAETFLTTLEAIAAARDPALRIDALSYRNRTMDLQLLASDVGQIDKFAKSLEQTRRFKPKIESANQNNDSIEGRLQIVSAQQR
ncbi:MAG TPA: type II secretion system protein GspL [Gammaproteobacteria bacterium]|nr:type II secretion system protein GspL [Gammaproteobacteria bacterium]